MVTVIDYLIFVLFASLSSLRLSFFPPSLKERFQFLSSFLYALSLSLISRYTSYKSQHADCVTTRDRIP